MNAIARSLLSRPSPAPILGVLESLGCGGFLLDPRARVLSLNSTAFCCLGDGLVLEGERLNATDRDSDQRLQSFIAAELRGAGRSTPPQSVAVRRGSRLPLVVRPHQLDGLAEEADGSAARSNRAPAPGLLLVVVDPEMLRPPQHDVLMQTFDLTRTEADIAIGVALGRALAQIATDRAIKVGTVRAHLKAVFAKTHSRSQADLTGTLTRLALLAPVAKGWPKSDIAEHMR
jgi:DNA-binding CsgD family transcriptional regulator